VGMAPHDNMGARRHGSTLAPVALMVHAHSGQQVPTVLSPGATTSKYYKVPVLDSTCSPASVPRSCSLMDCGVSRGCTDMSFRFGPRRSGDRQPCMHWVPGVARRAGRGVTKPYFTRVAAYDAINVPARKKLQCPTRNECKQPQGYKELTWSQRKSRWWSSSPSPA